jgi:hypothetical protein
MLLGAQLRRLREAAGIDWFETYLSLESAAVGIRTFEMQFVPGLLQTEDTRGPSRSWAT